jgi:hypothetical protein
LLVNPVSARVGPVKAISNARGAVTLYKRCHLRAANWLSHRRREYIRREMNQSDPVYLMQRLSSSLALRILLLAVGELSMVIMMIAGVMGRGLMVGCHTNGVYYADILT